MADALQPYRDAIAKRVHTVCWDRNLNPDSSIDTEVACRIERFLPQPVELAKAIVPSAATSMPRADVPSAGRPNAVSTAISRSSMKPSTALPPAPPEPQRCHGDRSGSPMKR